MSLFVAAMSRPEAERSAFIQEACAADSALLADVQRRVAWEARLNGFLLTPVVGRDKFDRTFAVGDLVLHRFRILRLAGEGGMGVVYEAFDEKLGRRIALKVPRFEFRKRLSPEASKSLQVTHPNVCRVFEIHTEETDTGEIDFLTMEFLEGETMAVCLPQAPKNWLATEEGAEIARQLCDGLQAIHAEGIVHRDLKPGNVMLTRAGTGKVRAVIMDFGISQGSDIFTSQARGTPAYLAPELWKGQPATVQSDIYALGVLLYEMTCGCKPFAENAVWKERFELPPPPKVGEPVRSALIRCLQPEAGKRFQSAAELKAALWKTSRRGLLFGVMGLAASGVAGGVLKDRYWPSSAVRLAILAPPTNKLTGETPALLLGFIHDVSSRLRALRGVHRPFVVFPLSLTSSEGVKSADAAQTTFAATHSLSTEFQITDGRSVIVVKVLESSSGKELQRWSESADHSNLGSVLFELQSKVLAQAAALFDLRQASPVHNLPSSVYSEYLQGLYFTRIDYENAAKAIPLFEKVISQAPDSVLGYAGLAEAFFGARVSLGDKSMEAKAAVALAKAEQLDPDSAHVHFMAGRLAAAGGSWERALLEFRRTTQLEPNDAEAFISLGYVHYMLNEPQQSEAAFLRAVAVQPTYYKPYLDTGLFYYEERNWKVAEKYWLEAVRLSPTQSRAQTNLADLYLNSGRLSEAWPYIEASLKTKKTRAAMETKADWLERSGRYQEAIAAYQEATRLARYYKTWAGLAKVYRRVGREQDAIATFRKGLEHTLEGLRANRREAERISWAAYYHAQLNEESATRAMAKEALGLAKRPSHTVCKRLVLGYDAIRDVEAALALLENVPPDLITELHYCGELSSNLHSDPRFVRLILF